MTDRHTTRPSLEEAATLADGPPIARPLGKMERSAWVYDQASVFNMGSAINLHGALPEAALRKVLQRCQQRYPILRSVVRVKRKKLHFACFDPARAPAIPLEVCSGVEQDIDRIATEELRRPFDAYREPLIRVKLVRFTEEHCSLMLTFSHLIGDGFSAANLLVEIVTQLGAVSADEDLPGPEPLPFPPMLEDGMPPQFTGLRGLFKLMGCQSRVMRRIKELGDMPTPLRNDADVPFAQRVPTIRTFSFDTAETAALIERARQENVTLYALLIAVTQEAIFPLLAESEKEDTTDRVITMSIPANLRPFLSIPVKADFGLFASTVDLVRKLTEHNDIPQMAREIRADIKSAVRKDSARLWVAPTMAAIMDWRLFFPNSSKGIARAARFVANMARYGSTSLTFLNFQRMPNSVGGLVAKNARGYLAPSMVGTALLSAVLFDDVLNVSLTYNEGQIARADAALLEGRFRETVLAVAAGAGTGDT